MAINLQENRERELVSLDGQMGKMGKAIYN